MLLLEFSPSRPGGGGIFGGGLDESAIPPLCIATHNLEGVYPTMQTGLGYTALTVAGGLIPPPRPARKRRFLICSGGGLVLRWAVRALLGTEWRRWHRPAPRLVPAHAEAVGIEAGAQAREPLLAVVRLHDNGAGRAHGLTSDATRRKQPHRRENENPQDLWQ